MRKSYFMNILSIQQKTVCVSALKAVRDSEEQTLLWKPQEKEMCWLCSKFLMRCMTSEI